MFTRETTEAAAKAVYNLTLLMNVGWQNSLFRRLRMTCSCISCTPLVHLFICTPHMCILVCCVDFYLHAAHSCSESYGIVFMFDPRQPSGQAQGSFPQQQPQPLDWSRAEWSQNGRFCVEMVGELTTYCACLLAWRCKPRQQSGQTQGPYPPQQPLQQNQQPQWLACIDWQIKC